jgi:hypothetical protein
VIIKLIHNNNLKEKKNNSKNKKKKSLNFKLDPPLISIFFFLNIYIIYIILKNINKKIQ